MRYLFSIVLLLIGCSLNTNKDNVIIVDELSGVWAHTEPDNTYREFVLSDKQFWTFTEEFGIWEYNYSLSGNEMNRTTKDGDPVDTILLEKFSQDSLWILKPEKYKCYRIHQEISIAKLLASDGRELDSYVKGFRSRRDAWQRATEK